MSKVLRWLAPILALGLMMNLSAFAEEAPEENPPAIQGAEEVAPPAEAQAEVQAPETQSANQEVAPATEPKVKYTADGVVPAGEASQNVRDKQLFDRIKALVKRFDAQARKGLEYTSATVESAIRAEFMRRTEGAEGPNWLKKRTREADREVALDNLELLVTYAEKLAWANPKKTGKDAGTDKQEAKILAAKAVVDKYNFRKSEGRGIASVNGFSPSHGLSAVGKAEVARRKALTAGQVAGDDYSPISAKKFDDFAKKYRQVMTTAVAEYEKLAKLVGGGNSSVETSSKKAVKKTKKAKSNEE